VGAEVALQIEGHGAVVAMKKYPAHDDVAGRHDEYEVFLLSAAHVLVDIANGEISLAHGLNSRFDCYAGELYISGDYMAKGLKDFGFVKLSHKDKTKITIRNVEQRRPTTWATVVEVGKSVVAHGNVFLRGTVVTSNMDDGRFSVLAHSVAGQNGILVFNNEKVVAGVVHGSSKHRGKHAAVAREDTASVVYCDSVGFSDLVCVGFNDEDQQKLSLLQRAECIPEKVASGSVTFGAFTKESNDSGEAEGMRELLRLLSLPHEDKLTLETVMQKLRVVVTAPATEGSVSFEDASLLRLSDLVPCVV
jgi:hypothetical protein